MQQQQQSVAHVRQNLFNFPHRYGDSYGVVSWWGYVSVSADAVAAAGAFDVFDVPRA